MGYHWDISGDFMDIYVCVINKHIDIYKYMWLWFVWLKPEVIVRSIRLGSVPLRRLIYTCLRLSKHFWRGSAYTCQEQHLFLKMFPDPVQWTTVVSNWKQTILEMKPQIIRKQWPTSCTFTSQLLHCGRQLLHCGLCTGAIIQCALAKSH